MVNVQHKSVCALYQNLCILLLGRSEERDLIDNVWSKLLAKTLGALSVEPAARRGGATANLVPGNLLVDVVLEQVTKALLEPVGQSPELCLEDGLIEEIAHAEATPGHLCAVGWANALLGCA